MEGDAGDARDAEELEDEDGEAAAAGLRTAQSILDAAEISIPTGSLVDGVYDSWGNHYQLPEWVVCDPENISTDVVANKDEEAGEEDTMNGGEDGDEGEDNDEMDRRKEKGKDVVDVKERVNLRARLSENGKDVRISVGKDETVKNVARRLLEVSGVCLFSPLSPSLSPLVLHCTVCH